jgi:hypothetical protein
MDQCNREKAYYVNPGHPNASDGNNYYCTVRTSCTHVNLIAEGYGTKKKPFGSINEAVLQVDIEGGPAPHTIYVAPGIYRESVYMAGRTNITLIADTTGVHTDTAPGEVIVTGAERLDASQFVSHPTLEGVYVWYDAQYPDGTSFCLTRAERGDKDCHLKLIVETNNPAAYRTPYTHHPDAASVAEGSGRFYYEVNEADPENPVLDIYIRTFDGGAPTEGLGLEFVPEQLVGNYTLDSFHKHKHCFDLEGGATGNTIQGFTCRYSTSFCINVVYGNNIIRDNLVYGSRSCGINVWASGKAVRGPINVTGNEVSHHTCGISVSHNNDDVYIENNVVHNNNYSGIFINVHEASPLGITPTMFIGNNTACGNAVNIQAGQHKGVSALANLVVVNNTFSHSSGPNYNIICTGTGAFSHNNWYGGTGYGTNPFPETSLLNVDPLFVDPPGFDFHLTPASELRSAGTDSTVSGYTPSAKDKDGVPRSDGYEIGAYEFIKMNQ